MSTLSTRTDIRIHCTKGSRTLVLDAEDAREIINTLIRQNLIEFSIENLPDYRKDKQVSRYRGVPHRDFHCHAAYAIASTTDAGAEVIMVCVDMADGFIDAEYHDAVPVEDLCANPELIGSVPVASEPLPQWAMQHPDVLNNMPRVEGGAANGE